MNLKTCTLPDLRLWRALTAIGVPGALQLEGRTFSKDHKSNNSFIHKLFKHSPALTDRKHNEMALLETAASDSDKGDEMSVIWLNQWQFFFSFFQGVRRANNWSPQHKGHKIQSVSHWEGSRDGRRFGMIQRSRPFHLSSHL